MPGPSPGAATAVAATANPPASQDSPPTPFAGVLKIRIGNLTIF